MKYLYLLTILLFITVSTKAQKYIPFPMKNAAWVEFYQDMDGGVGVPRESHIKQEHDTLIDGKNYVLLSFVSRESVNGTDGQLHVTYYKGLRGAIREDSLKHVYFYDFSKKRDTLLYDFNLKVGDNLSGTLLGYYFKQTYIVSVDSIQIGNTYHKQWGIGNGEHVYAYIIEGIGSSQGLLTRIKDPNLQIARLDCFSTKNECTLITSVSDNNKAEANFRFFPNPTSGQFTIQTQSIFSESYICVRDVLGRIVLQEKLQSPNQTFNISNQPKGLYFVEFDYIGRRIVQKLILQ